VRPVEVGVEVGKLRVAGREEVEQLLVGVVVRVGSVGEGETLERQRVALLQRTLLATPPTPSEKKKNKSRRGKKKRRQFKKKKKKRKLGRLKT